LGREAVDAAASGAQWFSQGGFLIRERSKRRADERDRWRDCVATKSMLRPSIRHQNEHFS
jgi:hypothetical protein